MLEKIAARVSRRIAIGLVTLTLVALVAVVFVTTRATAVGEHVEITYYSDASLTDAIGMGIKTCTGKLHRYGSVSVYSTAWSVPCSDASTGPGDGLLRSARAVAVPAHSSRRVISGSTATMRRTGTALAATQTKASTRKAPTRVAASVARTP